MLDKRKVNLVVLTPILQNMHCLLESILQKGALRTTLESNVSHICPEKDTMADNSKGYGDV